MHSLLEAMAGAACHGLDARSLCIAGCSLPFCARCTGLYIGVAAAALALAAAGRLRRRALPPPAVIAALGVPWALSGGAWLLEFGGIDVAGNAGRAVLGFACGASATVLLAPLWARVLWPEEAQGRCSRGAAAGLVALAAAVGLSAVGGINGTARYYTVSAATVAGFSLTVVAVNVLLFAGIALPVGRLLWARRAFAPCAAAAEIAALSALHGWLRAL
jgi:uncharacterized membrane protein